MNEYCDLVVVGAGGAGLSAAIHAAKSGLKVIVLEKNDEAGGTTGWSVGSFTASGTIHQKKAGILDNPDDHFDDMDKFNDGKALFDNIKLRRKLVDHSASTLNWLTSIGVVFDGPYPESHHRCPRMHNVIPNSKSFVFHLLKECNKYKIKIHLGYEVKDLLIIDGVVKGVVAQDTFNTKNNFYGSKGVLLTAGDFAANSDMKKLYLGQGMENAASVNKSATGDGIRMGLTAHSKIINKEYYSSLKMRFIEAPKSWIHSIPPYALIAKAMIFGLKYMPDFLIRPFVMKFVTTVLGPEPTMFNCGALMVNRSGALIRSDGPDVAQQLLKSPGNEGYIVFDEHCASMLTMWPNFISTAPGIAYAYLADYKSSRKDIFYCSDNLELLAKKIGVNPETFVESTKSKFSNLRGPFYALGPVRSYVTITEGGLSVNESFQVLNEIDQVIPGLFAAGSNGQGGLLLEGHGHHIAWAFVSGRLAGESIGSLRS